MSNIRKLSAREDQIINDVTNGLSTKEIAAKYEISFNTAKVHRHNIIKKMRVANMTEAAIKYLRLPRIA